MTVLYLLDEQLVTNLTRNHIIDDECHRYHLKATNTQLFRRTHWILRSLNILNGHDKARVKKFNFRTYFLIRIRIQFKAWAIFGELISPISPILKLVKFNAI